MGDPITTAFIATTVISVGSQIMGGFAANKAAKREASLLDEQAALAQAEAQAEAQRKANENRKFLKRQKLAFLKNGVTLEGSPLFILEDTLKEGQEEVNAITRQGDARARLFSARAEQTRNEGRSSLVGGITGGVGSVFNAFGTGKQAGIF